MDIAKKIGLRIKSARNEANLSVRGLAEKTKLFSSGRISNWERGTRKPGPAEAKVLGSVLGVAPSYILCLSNDTRGDLQLKSSRPPTQISLIDLKNAGASPSTIAKGIKDHAADPNSDGVISIESKSLQSAGALCFATHIDDSSMEPELTKEDIVIADPDRKPKPGDFVIAVIKESKDIVIRKYRQVASPNIKTNHFQLIAINPDWADIDANDNSAKIVATIIEHRRYW